MRNPGCLVIAEVAQAHDGSLGTAHAYIDAIADAGADAVKFQTHIAAAEARRAEPWRVKFSRQDATRYDYWRRMEFTEPQWPGLKQHADERGLDFLSSPFSMEAVELLSGWGWRLEDRIGEVGNLPLELMLDTGRPILLSTGMSSTEIDEAVRERRGDVRAVLQCTTAYPCPPEKMGLNMIPLFRDGTVARSGSRTTPPLIYPGLAGARWAWT